MTIIIPWHDESLSEWKMIPFCTKVNVIFSNNLFFLIVTCTNTFEFKIWDILRLETELLLYFTSNRNFRKVSYGSSVGDEKDLQNFYILPIFKSFVSENSVTGRLCLWKERNTNSSQDILSLTVSSSYKLINIYSCKNQTKLTNRCLRQNGNLQ